jgi:hypothetical protein
MGALLIIAVLSLVVALCLFGPPTSYRGPR